MPYSIDHDGIMTIQFGDGDIVAVTGTWDTPRALAGMTLAAWPRRIPTRRPQDAPPGCEEGDMGEIPLVRIAFQDERSVDSMIRALEYIGELLESTKPEQKPISMSDVVH